MWAAAASSYDLKLTVANIHCNQRRLLKHNYNAENCCCTCSHGHGPYSGASAGATWRVSFAVLIPVVLWVLYYRVYKLKELQILSSVKKRDGVKGTVSRCLYVSRYASAMAGSLRITSHTVTHLSSHVDAHVQDMTGSHHGCCCPSSGTVHLLGTIICLMFAT